jgi:hypothetical protein
MKLILVGATALTYPIRRIFPRYGANVEPVALIQTNQVGGAKLRDNRRVMTKLSWPHEADDPPNPRCAHLLNPIQENWSSLRWQVPLRASELRIAVAPQRPIRAH